MADKILLLTDIPPCSDFTAGINLSGWCSLVPRGRLVSFAVSSYVTNWQTPEGLEWMTVESAQVKLPKTGLGKSPVLSGGVTFLHNTFQRFPNINRLISKIAKFAERMDVNRIWCLLESDPVIRIAAPLARAVSLPLYTQVFDPPDWWLRAHKFDRISKSRVLRSFDDAIAMSRRCAATSWNMAEDYRRVYGVETVTLMPSFDSSLAQPAGKQLCHPEHLSIAIAGQLYASSEWDSLLCALDSVGWNIRGRKVIVRVVGGSEIGASPGRRIERLGWLTPSEMVKTLSNSDILYCPYWFDPTFQKEARQSFPSKVSAYAAAGRPIFFHGPDYASPARFVSSTSAGVCCHSLESNDIVDAIVKLMESDVRYSCYAENSRLAFDAFLSTERQREAFEQFLGLNRDLEPIRKAS